MKKKLFALLLILCMTIAITIPVLAGDTDTKNVQVYINIPDIVFTVNTAFTPLGDHGNLSPYAKFGEITVSYYATSNANLSVEFDGLLKNQSTGQYTAFTVHNPSNVPLSGIGTEKISLSASTSGELKLGVYLVGPPPTDGGAHTSNVKLVIAAAE